MNKSESIKDLKNVVRALVEFANDAVYGRLFEITHEESNLLDASRGRYLDLAEMVEPNLEDEPALHKDSEGLSIATQDRIVDFTVGSRFTYSIIGIFLGAAVADPTGKAIANVRAGWLRAMLAQPRYAGLKKRPRASEKTKRKGKENATIESIEDLEGIAKSLVRFAAGVPYGRMYKLDMDPIGLFVDDQCSECREELDQLAARIEPHLKTEPDPRTDYKALGIPQELAERLSAIIADTRHAFLIIGIFIGARVADATGNFTQRLGKTWIHSMLK